MPFLAQLLRAYLYRQSTAGSTSFAQYLLAATSPFAGMHNLAQLWIVNHAAVLVSEEPGQVMGRFDASILCDCRA